VPIPRKISAFKDTLTNLAQTSHYQVTFGGFSGPLRGYLAQRGIDSFFTGETVGIIMLFGIFTWKFSFQRQILLATSLVLWKEWHILANSLRLI